MERNVPILHEDERVIVLDKPAGMPSIPEGPGKTNDLLTWLKNYWGARPYVVHRLDKGVTGAICFARDEPTYLYLNAQFKERRVEKIYRALVHGAPEPPDGEIDLPLRKFGSHNMGVDHEKGFPAFTRYWTERRFERHSLLRLRPVSGRKHQLRAHMTALGHPIAGDRRYGDRRLQAGWPTILLHAASLSLEVAPGRPLCVEAPLPAAFREGLGLVEEGRLVPS